MGRLPSAGDNSYAHLHKSEREGRGLISRTEFHSWQRQRCNAVPLVPAGSCYRSVWFGYNSDGLEDVVSIGSLQIPAAVPSLHGRTIDLEQHHLELCKVRNLLAALGPAASVLR